MKKIVLSISAATLFMMAAHAQNLDRSVRPKPGPAPEIKMGDAESFTLANGMRVFVVEDHKLPIVSFSVQLDIQPDMDPERAGLDQFIGDLVTSGTKTRTKDKFNEEVDAIGAHLSASSSGVFGRSLVRYQEQLLGLMSDAIINAEFKQEEVDKLKKQMSAGLEANKNDPDDMVSNVSAVLNYGPKHPYGQVVTPETIEKVDLQHCKEYYRTYFRPNVAYMAIVGDITVAKAKELVEKYFNNWEKAPVIKAQVPQALAPATTTVNFVPRPGAVQSVVDITYPINLGIGTPDVIKARVLNQVLGGSFQRLDRNLRETHAWTYGSNSSISADELVGNVSVFVKCRNEVTDSAISEMIREMDLLTTTPLTKEELQASINYLSGVFALGLERPQTIAQYAINIERYNMPKNYYKDYLKNLSQVSIQDVQATAQKFLKPQHANIVVVGNKTEMDKIKRFAKDGEVRTFDNYGNPIKVVASQVINGVDMDRVLDNYIQAIGGREAIESVKDLTISAKLEGARSEMGISIVQSTPNKLKQAYYSKGPDGPVLVQKIVIDGDKGYMESPGGKQAVPASMIEEYKPEIDLQVLLHPEKYNITYTLLSKEIMDKQEVYNVEMVYNDGKSKKIQFYDVKTGLLVKEVENNETGGQPQVKVTTFSDYKEVKNTKGFKMPFKMDIAGQGIMTVNSVKANSGVKDSAFK